MKRHVGAPIINQFRLAPYPQESPQSEILTKSENVEVMLRDKQSLASAMQLLSISKGVPETLVIYGGDAGGGPHLYCFDKKQIDVLCDTIQNSKSLQILLINGLDGFMYWDILLQAIVGSTSLKVLDLSMCGANIADLATALKGCKLENLILENNKIGVKEAETLAGVVETATNLQALNVNDNKINDAGALRLVAAIKKSGNIKFRTLSMVNNHITRDGAVKLASSIEDIPSMEGISLGHPWFDDNVAAAFARVINKSSRMKELRLSTGQVENENAEIGDDGAEVLAEAVANSTTMQSLDLSNNGIGGEGAYWLAATLCSPSATMRNIELSENHIGSGGLKSFAAALLVNTSLESLEISCGPCDDVDCCDVNLVFQGIRALLMALSVGRKQSCDLRLVWDTYDSEPPQFKVLRDKLAEVRVFREQDMQGLATLLSSALTASSAHSPAYRFVQRDGDTRVLRKVKEFLTPTLPFSKQETEATLNELKATVTSLQTRHTSLIRPRV